MRQTNQISQIHAAVESTVTSTVEKGMKSYSDAVKLKTSDELVPPVILKETVKQDVEQTDQSKHVMIFGFPDVETENTDDAVKPVLEIIQEKPRIMEAIRLGRFVEGSS